MGGWTVPPEGTGFLAESLPSWPPFSDTNPALARLAGGGVKLGILSNVDDDLFAHAELWAAAGTPDSVFRIDPEQLLRVSGGTAADFAER